MMNSTVESAVQKTNHIALAPSAQALVGSDPRWQRVGIGASRDSQLFFAQVREDPLLEIEAFQPGPGRHFASISSGGCTALSLLAAGAESVTCIDLNRTQNHLVELKMAAICHLPDDEVLPFLGAHPALPLWRRQRFLSVQSQLSPLTRGYWLKRMAKVEQGVLSAGVTEKLNRLLIKLCCTFVHKRETLHELLAQPTLEAQSEFYDRVWNNRRWRAIFKLLYGRGNMSRTYSSGFYARASSGAFGQGFLGLVEHSLKRVPISDNYFLHHIATGFYLSNRQSALPPYLTRAGMACLRATSASGPRLRIVDGSMTDYLASLPKAGFDGVVLSNICEWMNDEQIEALFAQALRATKPGGKVCYRDHMGATAFPARFADQVRAELETGDQLILADRSMVQRGFRIFEVRGEAARQPVARLVEQNA